MRTTSITRHGNGDLERYDGLRRLGGTATALGYGAGVGAWGTGSPMYGWGYSGYSNPYSAGYGGAGAGAQAVAPQQTAAPAYNYSQPISTTAAPPEQAVASQSASASRPGPRCVQGGRLRQGPAARPAGARADAQ